MRCGALIYLGNHDGWSVCGRPSTEMFHFRHGPPDWGCPKHLAEHRQQSEAWSKQDASQPSSDAKEQK
jgi:hypothetical protein